MHANPFFNPLHDPVTEPKIKFDETQIKAMNIVERVFGA